MHVAPQLLAQAQRQQWPLAVLMLDLDHFKRVNDVHGHETGDRALALFADVIRSCLRDNDVAARIGGEEFVLLLPHTDAPGAALLDARLRGLLLTQSADLLGWPLNYSAGLVLCPVTGPHPLEAALQQADQALYQAKASGRGQLCQAHTPTDPGQG
jgi:diguanylate cyclase (GGDEF)-like protein